MSFSDNLARVRRAHRMTQEQLAMLMGVSRQAISKWESERAYPETDKLVRLCDIFEVNLDDLVRGDGENIEVRPGVVMQEGATPTDICGYDQHMRRQALMRAAAPATALIAFAILFGTGPDPLYTPDLMEYARATPFGIAIVACGLIASVCITAKAALEGASFSMRHPFIENFYAHDDSLQAKELKKRSRVVAVLAACTGITAFLIKSGPLFHLAGGLASLFDWGAVALWITIYAHNMQARLDIDSRNRRSSRLIARFGKSNAREESDDGDQKLAEVRMRLIVTLVAIAALTLILVAALALLAPPIAFIPAIAGAAIAALVIATSPRTALSSHKLC